MDAQASENLSTEGRLLLFLVAALWLLLVPLLVERLLALLRLHRTNFQGCQIPTGYGLVILLWSAPLFMAHLYFRIGSLVTLVAYLMIVVGMGILGLIDDLWGDRSVTGLRAHFRKFFIDGEVTTGFVKAVGGSALGVLLPRLLLGKPWPDALLDGATIALCANALNLLDLRPGRACAAFLLGALAILLAHAGGLREPRVSPLIFVVIPTLVVYERDARARAMLGDTGSNLLGGVLGLAFVLADPALPLRYAALVALVLLHVLAERYSLSALIERNSLLRRLDRLTGKRE